MAAVKRLFAFLDSERFDGVRKFYEGRWYPPLALASALISQVFALELIFVGINVFLLTFGLAVCKSAKPALVIFLSSLYHISLKHSPAVPAFSDFFFKLPWLPYVLFLGAVLLLSLVFFALKNNIFKGVNIKTPGLIPLLVLSVGFLLNGAFSGGWSVATLLFGLLQVVCYLGVYLYFFCGLKGERADELTRYFCYISALISWVLLIQLFAVYLRCGFAPAKEEILLGWGIWNTIGASLNVLIPACFLGFYLTQSKTRWLYLATAFATYLGAVLSKSRGALLTGGIIFGLCFVTLCFFGRDKRLFRIGTLSACLLIAVGAFAFREKLGVALEAFFNDNGRYDLWKIAIDNFKSAPIFGMGFTAYESESLFESFTAMPDMAHNTLFQLLGSMGAIGSLCYGFYRASTVYSVAKRPSAEKLLLGLCALSMLLGSLFDNFVFYFTMTFHYTVALCIINLINMQNDNQHLQNTSCDEDTEQ